MKTEPLYGLPYLEGTDLGRDIPNWSSKMATQAAAALARGGAVPISAELQTLLARLAALETAPGGGMKRGTTALTLKAGAWNLFTGAGLWAVDQPLSAGVTFTNGVWRADTAGLYSIEAGVTLAAAVPMIFGLKKNNAEVNKNGLVVSTTVQGLASFTSASVSKRVRMAAGDTIMVAAFVGTAADWDASLPEASHFNIRRVEALR